VRLSEVRQLVGRVDVVAGLIKAVGKAEAKAAVKVVLGKQMMLRL
jgi:hypothetical protein